jgi:hypothetical protein
MKITKEVEDQRRKLGGGFQLYSTKIRGVFHFERNRTAHNDPFKELVHIGRDNFKDENLY